MAAEDDEVVHPPVVERVKIAVRERPVADEHLASVEVQLRTSQDKLVAFAPGATDGTMYDYDYYYPQRARQEDLAGTIGLEMVDVVMGGLSTSCVVVGLADTGKTHTLFGSANEPGLIHLTVRELFTRLAGQADTHDSQVTLRYWEMGRDTVTDCLVEEDRYASGYAGTSSLAAPTSTAASPAPVHNVYRDKLGRLYVSGITEVDIASYEEFDDLLNEGNGRRINRGVARMARWHGFVQLSISTTDRANAEKCVLRTMTFVHTKGADRVGEKGARGQLLRENSQINVSVTLLYAATIHSLEYREKRQHLVRTREDLHALIRKSQSFFMECRFSQIMAQLLCGHEAGFVIGCVNTLNYGETVDTLENLQLLRGIHCACVPVVITSERGGILRRLRLLERRYGDADSVAALYNDRHNDRPRTEEEEELVQLRATVEGWTDIDNVKQQTAAREEELRQRNQDRLSRSAAMIGVTGANQSASTGSRTVANKCATHGTRKRIYLNPAKTATYEGQWGDGLFDGFGEHIQPTFKYRGEFRRGKREGEGTLFVRASAKDPLRRVYHGEWLDGKRDGHGTEWGEDGEVYEGSFSCDLRNGIGKLFLPSGDTVEGDFSDGLCEGWATLRKPNGDWFEGFWSHGMREGPGVWHYAQRQQCLRGEWSKDVAKMGVMEDDPDKIDNANSGFIPRVEVVAHVALLDRERAKLNERRRREFAASRRPWVDPVEAGAVGGPAWSAAAEQYSYRGDDDALFHNAAEPPSHHRNHAVEVE